MGCSSSSQFKNDKYWEDRAKWGKEMNMKTWNKNVSKMDAIAENLYMGSRLSAQQVIDKGNFSDQYGNIYDAKQFHTICVASGDTCDYCQTSSKYNNYHIYDRHNQSDDFLGTALVCARKMHKYLRRKKNVLVHCHSGRNRSALVILVYAALYTDLTFEESICKIRQCNSHRFEKSATLQNNQFTQLIKERWHTLRQI